jgi:hypothetical protein
MTIENTLIDKTLKELLQKNVRLQFKSKPFKQGKLLLYQQNNYYISLLLQNSKKGNVKFEIPIPYHVESWPDEKLVYFDYRLSTLSKKKDSLYQQLKSVRPTKISKYYDSILEIIILPDMEAV